MQNTNTQLALRLLMNAYATDGEINIPRFLENLQEQAVAAFKDNGELISDDQILILNSTMPNAPILETLADISYAAGAAGYTTGNSREDVQNFIYLANKFEEEFEGYNGDEQENEDYMDEIEKFTTANLRLLNKLSFEYPQRLVEPWDNLEIAGCKQDNDGNVYRLDDATEEPDFWTIYVHQVDGGVMAIADVPTEKHADDLAELINNAVISFKNNGFMPILRNAEAHRQFNLYIDERIKGASSQPTMAAYEAVKKQFNDLVKL